MITYNLESFTTDLKQSTWLFDFFGLAFDHLDRHLDPSSFLANPEEPILREMLSIEGKLAAFDGEVPDELWPLLSLPATNKGLTDPSFLQRLFFLLQAIDHASADLNYFNYGLGVGRWRRVTRHLHLNNANLALNCDGAVTIMPPRLGRPHPESWLVRALERGWHVAPQRGIHFRRYFHNLARVSQIPGCNVTHRVIPPSADVSPNPWPRLKIGFVPTIHELSVHAPIYAQCKPGPLRIVPSGDGKFSMGMESPDSASWNEFGDRLRQAFEFFIREGVQLVVFPELTIPDPTLGQIKNLLRTQNAAAESRIELVLAGTFLRNTNGSPRPSNTAVVLNGAGEELFRQRKMQPYEMLPYEQKRYGLSALFGGQPAKEDIECFPRDLVVCDSCSSGFRIATLICEDSCHQRPAISAVQQLNANLLFVPVMAGALLPERQFSSSASALAQDPGAITMICNSAALASREQSDPPLAIISMPLQDPSHMGKWFISKNLTTDNAEVLLFTV